MIMANGGSGSKRFLRILDQSPQTHCRGEPYNLSSSPFAEIRTFPLSWVVTDDDENMLEARWDDAVRWSAVRMGDRDRLPPPPKEHLHPLARRLGLLRAVSSRTIRTNMGRVLRGFSKDEWLLPRWLGDRDRVERALLIMKFNQAPGIGKWILANRRDVKILHLVRHPAARLASWRVRHLSKNDPELVRQRNAARLEAIRSLDESWAPRFGDIDGLSVEESELFYWLFESETLYGAGKDEPQYLLTTDEQVIDDPVSVAERLYETLGLGWPAQAAEWVRGKAPHWQDRTAPWRELLPSSSIETVEKILDASVIKEWWAPDQVVSRIDYDWS